MGRCVGKVRIAKDYFKDEWKEVFQIDDTSPSGLSWKINGNNKTIGKPVGWLTELNYWKCEYKNKSVLVHRILFLLYYGHLHEESVIDHIDGNPLNNSKENLRQISYAENCRNKKLAINNRTGLMGVHENHDFVVTWSDGEKQHSKKFSVIKLGYDKAKELAQKFRDEKINNLNSQGFNYTDRHGTT